MQNHKFSRDPLNHLMSEIRRLDAEVKRLNARRVVSVPIYDHNSYFDGDAVEGQVVIDPKGLGFNPTSHDYGFYYIQPVGGNPALHNTGGPLSTKYCEFIFGLPGAGVDLFDVSSNQPKVAGMYSFQVNVGATKTPTADWPSGTYCKFSLELDILPPPAEDWAFQDLHNFDISTTEGNQSLTIPNAWVDPLDTTRLNLWFSWPSSEGDIEIGGDLTIQRIY